ncbi:MAG: serpin family protein [Proteiniphilum sp.]|nr:serpin family protein [Proteiniphilum sp.]
MKPFFSHLRIALLTALLLVSSSCDQNGKLPDGGELSDPIKISLRGEEVAMLQADQQFAFDFFTRVFEAEAAGKDRNFMVSPLSLSMALAMTRNGAAGDTEAAMTETMNLTPLGNEAAINSYYRKLREALLTTDPSTKLSIANSIWTNKDVTIKPAFIAVNRDYFHSTVEAVDFGDVVTVGRINRWAADNTEKLIDHVLDETDPMALMYLLNAIYFKGIWSSPFDAKQTSKRPFTDESGTVKNVDMMHQKAVFRYHENEVLQMVELPYGNQAFSMVVLLPKAGKRLSVVNAALQNGSAWGTLQSALCNAEVDLCLPRFKTEYSKRLNDVLSDMGMGIAFIPGRANFSRMSDADAFISFVDQFTYINTNEEGTEAAAVTAVGMQLTAVQKPRSVTFHANRPFVYLIRENSSGAILFMGAVKNFP